MSVHWRRTMDRRGAVACARAFTAAVSFVVLSRLSTAQNLVTNGGFEDGLGGWQRSHRSPASAIKVSSRGGGGRALQITNATGDWHDWMHGLSLSPEKRYLFQFELKRDRAGSDIFGFVRVERTKGQDYYYTLGAGQIDVDRWQTFAAAIRPPRDLTAASVCLMNRLAGSTAWFDNIQLVELTGRSAGTTGCRPALAVPRLETRPVLDGRVHEAEWKGAAWIGSFVQVADGGVPRANTRAWVARDRSHLLVAARCHEPFMAQTRRTVEGHDAGGVFGDEVVEIFLDPDNDHSTYYHFALGILGADYDASMGEPPAGGTAFESGWTTKVHCGEDFWSIETAIPFDGLHLAGAGDVWGLNICRERHVPGHRENTAWSATGKFFHNPRRFGDIVGFEDAGKHEVRLTVDSIDDVLPGASVLTVRAENSSAQERSVRIRAAVVSPSGEVLRLARVEDVPEAGTRSVELPLRLSDRGEWTVRASCEDAHSGQLLHDGARFAFRVPPLLEARIVEPWWRGRVFSKMALEEAVVEAGVALRETERTGLSIRAELRGRDGFREVVTREALARTNTVSLPLTGLPEGTATLDVRLLSADGAPLATVADLQLFKLPPADEEIWFDRDNNLYINGRAHFPTGFYAADHRKWFERIRAAGYSAGHSYRTARPARLGPEGDARSWVDSLTKAGLRAFLGVGYKGKGGDKEFVSEMMAGNRNEAKKLIADFIVDHRQSPGLLGWYLYDEPSLAGRTPEEIRFLYGLADGLDPYHPKLVCQVHWSDSRFVEFLDVLMPDDYPIRPQGDRPLRCIAETVMTARRTVRDEKPVWPVLQWYRYEGGRFPTPREMRCMAYAALAAGAKGLTWFSWWHGITEDYKHYQDLFDIGRELRALEDVVLAPEAPVPILPTAGGEVLITLTKVRSEQPGKQAGLMVIVVNQEPVALPDVRFALPARWAVAAVTERLSAKPLAVSDAGFTDSFVEYEPKVYDIRAR